MKKLAEYRTLVAALSLTFLLVWMGCETTGQEPVQDPPFFEITVDGDITDGFSGQSAFFGPFTEEDTGLSGIIVQMVANGAGERGVALSGRFEGLPPEGSHTVVEFDTEAEDPFGDLDEGELFAEFITTDTDDLARTSYTSLSGTLNISLSSEERLEGSFVFSAQEVGVEDEDEAGEIEVSGDFEAQRQ